MYAWYEIIPYAVIVGIICFAVFRGLDLILEWALARRIKADIDAQNRDDGRGA